MKLQIIVRIFLMFFFLNAPVFADEHGSYHYGNSYYNGEYQGYDHNVWYGGAVHVNSWSDGIWYDNNLNNGTNAVVGVPDEGYDDPSCQTIDDCNTGTCVLVNTCE